MIINGKEMNLNIDLDYTLTKLKEIMEIDSPSGFTGNVIKHIGKISEELGVNHKFTERGNCIIYLEGENTEKTIGVCAHVDTLGLMVRSIKGNGNLAFTSVGGPILPTLDGEYCRVYTRCGKVYSGTILSTSPAIHVHEGARSVSRDEKTMEVKLDEIVKNANDVKALGISNGDFICYDTKTVITENGFIKSRFLDDKLSASIILGLIKWFVDNKIKPSCNIQFFISTYEEVGSGMSWIPEGIHELLAIDMGCIGDDLSCTEYDVSICAKDGGGPYDYDMTTKLINLAKENRIQYAVDIYPMYSSDATAAFRGGNDVKGALIGPGVAASHGMERSHTKAVINTGALALAYLLS